ncbi:MAG: flagellar basal body P-ring protein FlgI [Phycisphaeraceae bacterium]
MMNTLTLTTHAASLRTMAVVALLLAMLMPTPAAHAVQLQDMSRIKGAESSRLIGMGLVIGLNGTGDGERSATTMRRLASMMNRLGDPLVDPVEMEDARNVAIVYLSATAPGSGVREGDKINVNLAAPIASSLEGGRLVMTPILGPLPGSPVFAYAEGPITVEDTASPRTAVVHNGATLTRDIYSKFTDDRGRMTLVLEDANATWPMATTVATLVNDLMAPDAPPIAIALDQKNVVIQIPDNEMANPGPFISQILELQLDPSLVRTEARVVINERTGTIVMTDNVEISPVVISHKGMTITTVTPQRNPTIEDPEVDRQGFVAIDPQARGGAKLADLVNAFNQLKVPAEDRIAIIREIHRSGKLHAQLVSED